MAIIQLLKAAKTIRDYVVKENSLDQQMEIMQKRVAKLEEDSHPKRDFVTCNNCKCKLK